MIMELNVNVQDKFEIRPAREEDTQKIFDLVMELIIYEKLEHISTGTVEKLRTWAFGTERFIHIYCGWLGDKIIGYTIHFLNFSTFLCRPGIYLEDIYVQPEYRGRKYGTLLLNHLCKLAKSKGYGRVEWQVLDWNTPSIKFYESLGAKSLKDWIIYRLDNQEIDDLLNQEQLQ